MIREIAPFVDGFVPKKANKYRETRVQVTFKNSVERLEEGRGEGGRSSSRIAASRKGDGGIEGSRTLWTGFT